MRNKMKQKAKDNSTQFQAEVINYNMPFDENRVREICNEQLTLRLNELINEGQADAIRRGTRFSEALIEKFKSDDINLLEIFKKPEFLALLKLAQQTAIQTDHDTDYEILTNLLLNKTKKSDDRKFGSGIKHAIQIVDEIDEDSLNGLTALFIYTTFAPTASSPVEYFETLDELFKKCLQFPLPSGPLWSDQLDILKCCRIDYVHKYVKGLDYYISKHKYLFTSGINKNCKNYTKAIEILKANNLPSSILIDNELFENYVRLKIVDEKSIDDLSLTFNVNGHQYESQLSDGQKNAIREVLNLYDTSINNEKIKESLIKIISKFHYVSLFIEWLDELKNVVEITIVGRVLAYTNAKMKYDKLPEMF